MSLKNFISAEGPTRKRVPGCAECGASLVCRSSRRQKHSSADGRYPKRDYTVVNFRLPRELNRAIDRAAAASGESKSTLIRGRIRAGLQGGEE